MGRGPNDLGSEAHVAISHSTAMVLGCELHGLKDKSKSRENLPQIQKIN